MIKTMFTALTAAALAGCATVQIPPAQLEHSEASIRGAEELGATNVPAARLHLQLAKDQNQAARKLAEAGDPRALVVLARAEADAELALGLAREAALRTDAKQATEDLNALRARSAP